MRRLAWAILLSACVAGPRPEEEPAADGDHDGVADTEDCAPGDPELPAEDDASCDGVDSDCDGEIDEDAFTVTWYGDADEDGAGDPEDTAEACAAPLGYVATAEDCDPGNGGAYPGAPEDCDAVDSDCDGDLADEDRPDRSPEWYADADADGWGDEADTVNACFAPEGYVAPAGDCDDADPAVNPGAAEVCDDADVDEDCDGLADDADWAAAGALGWGDADGDGWGDPLLWTCEPQQGVADVGGDCDDADPTVHPAAEEVCGDGWDNDCDGEDPAC